MSEWGLFGLAASALFWSGRDFAQTGVYAIMEWEVVQIPVYAWKPDGNPTKQLFDGVMGMTDRTTVNGVVTDFSQVGVNVVGIIIVTWAARSRERLDLWRRRSVVSAAV